VRWLAFQQRRPTEAEIRTWWRRWPDSNIIVLTGEISGIVAIDVDPRHGGDEAIKGRELPETPISLTGGGGVHYLYAWPGHEVKNATNVLPGVDFRGDGGYIIAPGSMHSSGRTYEWDSTAHPDDVDLGALPQWFLKALLSGDRFAAGSAGEPRKRPPTDAILLGEATVGEGERNEVMASVVGSLIRMNPDEADEATLVERASGINERQFVPPLSMAEVTTIVRSILRREDRKVRAAAVARAVTHDMVTAEALEPVEELAPDDRIEQVRALWASAGVSPVSDWFALIDSEGVSYMLVTPENEVRLGSDLLNYAEVRRILLNQITVLMPSAKKPADWDRIALRLRQLAREEQVEALRAVEQVDEWVEEYTRANVPAEDPAPAELRDYLTAGPVLVKGVLWLRAPQVARFVERTFGEKMDGRRMGKMLRRAGWDAGHLADGNGSSIRGWRKVG